MVIDLFGALCYVCVLFHRFFSLSLSFSPSRWWNSSVLRHSIWKKRGGKGKKKCFSYFANEPHNTWKCFFSQRRRHLSPVGYFIRNGGRQKGKKNKVTHASSSSSSSWSRTCGGERKSEKIKKNRNRKAMEECRDEYDAKKKRLCVCVLRVLC